MRLCVGSNSNRIVLSVFLFLLVFCPVLCVSATDVEYDNCNCEDDDEEGVLSIHNILISQKVSDFLISIAYFSIPIEILYFISRSNVPFKLLFLQFIAFIVLCGMTHLLNVYSYHGPPSFQLLLSVTIAKFLTALVSCATALTLPPLIPLLLKFKIRELFLRQNVLELDQEVGLMKKQKEASYHVRMLTREIRKSLDKHTILYTTLVELSKALALHNCAVWMPDKDKMHLTHELIENPAKKFGKSIPRNDHDVLEIKKAKGVRILRPQSLLGIASSGGREGWGAMAGIRMPILHVSNFKGGTPEMIETCYAILVLVLPKSDSRAWTNHELELVEVVADQVAVALSHAAILEESHRMRKKLAEQNRALQQAKKDAMMASQARKAFKKVMSDGMRRPLHSTLGLLSLVQEDNMKPEQKIISETMLKVSSVVSSLVNDVMEISENEKGSFRFRLEMKPLPLHSMMKEAACIAKCLCLHKGFGFEINVQKSLPDQVIGDEERVFRVILHMIGYLLNIYNGGRLNFRVSLESGSRDNDKTIEVWRTRRQNEYVHIKFDFQINGCYQSDESVPTKHYAGKGFYNNEPTEFLSISMCKKLVQMMQGDIWISPNSQGLAQGMTLLLKFKIGPYLGKSVSIPKDYSNSQFRGLKVVLADHDCTNRIVTKKLLEKIGCQVTAISSGFNCLNAVSASGNAFRIILLDLHMPEMDGFEAATRIRNFHSHNWPLIVALAASAEENEKQKCIQVGMNGFIQKPVLLHEMAEELRRVLHRAGG